MTLPVAAENPSQDCVDLPWLGAVFSDHRSSTAFDQSDPEANAPRPLMVIPLLSWLTFCDANMIGTWK